MKKDAYYFPHFCNARHDRKIRRILSQLGAEGYAIYFMLLEVLREQQDLRYPMSDVDLLVDEFKTTQAKIEAVIKSYDLFQIDEDGKFFSMKFIFYLQPYLERTERARTAAQVRWNNVKDANALPEDCGSNARKGEESKVKKRKQNYSETEFPIWFDEALQASWREYIAYRQVKKIPIATPESMQRQYRKIENLSGGDSAEACAIISQTIDFGYRGLFPLSEKSKQTAGGQDGIKKEYGRYADIVQSYLNNTEIRKTSRWKTVIFEQFYNIDKPMFLAVRNNHVNELKEIDEPMEFIEFIIEKSKAGGAE